MDKHSGIYIDFDGEGHFVFVGGMTAINATITKEPVETADYISDFRKLISESGVSSLDIKTNMMFDPNVSDDLYKRLIESIKNGTLLKVRLVQPLSKLKIEGNFIINSLDESLPNKDIETLNVNFLSSGEWSVSDQ